MILQKENVQEFFHALDHLVEALNHETRDRLLAKITNRIEKGMVKVFRLQKTIFIDYFKKYQHFFKESIDLNKELAAKIAREMAGEMPPPILNQSLAAKIAKSMMEEQNPLGALEGNYLNKELAKKVMAEITTGAVNDMNNILDNAFIATKNEFNNAVNEEITSALAIGGQQTLINAGINFSFNLKNPRAITYLENHGAELITKINDTTRAEIKEIITHAMKEGWSYNQTADAITNRFEEFAVGKPQLHIDSRAHLVAVTESANAYEAGAREAGQQIQEAGISLEKFWQTVGDERVSDGCAENEDADWIDFDEAFPSGDENPPRFPGCRCTALYRRKETE